MLNAAVTDAAAFIVTLQLPVPEQAPLQPAKLEPAPGAAVSVSTVPILKASVQSPPQSIPTGVLETVPVPSLILFTVSAKVFSVNVAVTEAAVEIVTKQVPVPEHPAPFQPAKSESAFAAAVNVIV